MTTDDAATAIAVCKMQNVKGDAPPLAAIQRNANEISVYNGFCKLVFVNLFTNFAQSDTPRSCVTRNEIKGLGRTQTFDIVAVIPGR
jgi:hypothetical protein